MKEGETAKVKITEIIKPFFQKEARLKFIVALGLLGMLLILISQFTQRPAAPAGPPENAVDCNSAEEYATMLENRLSVLISDIEGVGRNKVMVTLESGVEFVYAREEKRGTDITRDGGEDPLTGRVTQRENIEERYILIDTEFGRRQALVLTQLQPRIQGVVIVCEGAGDARVQQKLISVVTTALGIASTRVCVVQIN
jgi:stage III sporulation protein AG